MLAAVPYWISDNIPLLSLCVMLLVAIVVLRTVQKAMTRILCLLLIVAVGIAVYIERDDLKQCVETCECAVFEVDLELPACSPRR